MKALTGRLARENARRTPRRTATTAASLMIGLGLVATVAILSSSVEDTIIQAVEDSFTADIVIQPGGFNPLAGLSDEIHPLVVETDGVISAARLNLLPAVFPDGTPNLIVGIEPETVELAINFEDVEGEWEDVTGDGVAVQRIAADTDGLALGDPVEFEFASGVETFRVAAIFDLQGSVSDSQNYYVNYHRLRELDPTLQDYSVMVKVAADADVDLVTEQLNAMLADFGGATASGIESLVAQVSGPIKALTGMVAGLLFMSVIVAVVGIVLTLYLAVHERTREIGLLRAIGMTRQQVSRTIRWESVFIALYGALLGLTIGIFLGWGLTVTIIGDGAALAIPWTWVIAGFVGSAIAGVVASIVPARQAAKLDILAAIAYE
jgi:putative ABC transport system permease protein